MTNTPQKILTESELQDFERWANGEPVQGLHCFPHSVWRLIASHRALAEQRDKYEREIKEYLS